ncbi:MAG: TlyA family RNA methyltransferase [Holophagales bacterium]|nr:TlyA family RNA methyltransferase [Holophagales bacterium]
MTARARSRLDQLLVDRGLFESREKARRAVLAGVVEVEGHRVDKPGTPMPTDTPLTVRAPAEPFVSRAGRKLAAALDHFGIDPQGLRCLDVGASTGGFTDCLLQRGAISVTALDVGYGLIDARLRADPRVEMRERTNARHLAADAFDRPFDLVVVDVSFISVALVAPALVPHLAPEARLLVLVKPQFEVGRGNVGKGGIVRDEALRSATIEARADELAELGLELVGTFDSPVAGAEGNREAFAFLRKGAT